MDKKLFTDKSAGKLISVDSSNNPDWAFIPDPLPTSWQIPLDLWPLLLEAHKELARLDGIGRNMPNFELLIKPLQQREALKSSSLEGTYATAEQLLFFEIDPNGPKSKFDQVAELKEVWNYSNALKTGLEGLPKIALSLRLIKDIHATLLQGVRGQSRDPGNFRKVQVHIGSDRRFIPPPPQIAETLLYDLEKYIHQDSMIDPLILCFLVHYQFETIHPFVDGNGRVGRLFLSLMIFEKCGLAKPWLYLSAFFERYKDEYIQNLFEVSTKGNFDNWIKFCLRATIEQAKDAILRFDELMMLRDKYKNLIRNQGGNARLDKLIEKLFVYPVLTIPLVAHEQFVTWPTAKKDVMTLLDLGIIKKTKTKNKLAVYYAIEILNITHRDF